MRLQGWEARLADVVEQARFKPFVWGEHDCYRFACQAVEALTGHDLWQQVAGYRTKWGALRLIARTADSWEDCVSWYFGAPCAPNFARVGDVMMVPAPRMAALGVCVGREVAVLHQLQLGFVQRRAATLAWRIG